MSGAQAPYARVALADGTLVATREVPGRDLIPHLLATSDVLGTGWFAADAANVKQGSVVAVVGDGASVSWVCLQRKRWARSASSP
jgi:threonine dehydrogenase-like Zn-dependent dehydrogenase